MRASILVLASVCLVSFACGGGIAPSGTTGDGSGTSTGSGASGTSGGSGASGASGDKSSSSVDGQNGGSAAAICTAGSYVFCRCSNGAEGTKECLPDRRFGACACDDVAPPPPPPCSYPPANNPPDCPGSYSRTYHGQPCPLRDLHCIYPGQGDGDGNGCWATAGLQCRVAPGGGLFWTATQ